MITTQSKTNQQISDELAGVLTKQNKRAKRAGFCAYGTEEFTPSTGERVRCAAGHFLPDTEEINTYVGPIHELVEARIDLGENTTWIKENLQLLQQLQGLHDNEEVYHKEDIATFIQAHFHLNMDAWKPWINATGV